MSLSCLCVKCEATASCQLAQLKGQLHQILRCVYTSWGVQMYSCIVGNAGVCFLSGSAESLLIICFKTVLQE